MNDDVFVGFDVCAEGGAAALCTRNADGTVNLVHIAPFEGPGGDELFASQSYRAHLDGWSALTLRIWSDHVAAVAELDRVVDGWADWVAPLACAGPFDWMSWAPWKLWRIMTAPNPVFDPPQLPRIPGLDCHLFDSPRTRPVDGYTLDAPFTPLTPSRWGLLANDEARRRSWRDVFDRSGVGDADLGEPLAPDTDHGGDRHPGRYA